MDEHELETLDRVHTAPEPDDPRKPRHYWQLKYRYWVHALRRAGAGFWRHNTLDSAAALTFFSVLSFVPALLALVALLTQVGQGQATTAWIMSLLERAAPEDVVTLLEQPIARLTQVSGAGYVAVVSVALAIWSASTYVAAFGRAMNGLYEVAEGRPLWKIIPYNLMLTAGTLVGGGVGLLTMVLSNRFLLTFNGTTFGPADSVRTFLERWDAVRWPVLLVVAVIYTTALYHLTPNVRQGRFRWVTPGSVMAIVGIVLAALGFNLYVDRFSALNATYGVVGSFIVLLLGLWIMNCALVFGGELDSEVERVRELAAGIEAERHLQLPPRDVTMVRTALAAEERFVEEGRRLRTSGAGSPTEPTKEQPAG